MSVIYFFPFIDNQKGWDEGAVALPFMDNPRSGCLLMRYITSNENTAEIKCSGGLTILKALAFKGVGQGGN